MACAVLTVKYEAFYGLLKHGMDGDNHHWTNYSLRQDILCLMLMNMNDVVY